VPVGTDFYTVRNVANGLAGSCAITIRTPFELGRSVYDHEAAIRRLRARVGQRDLPPKASHHSIVVPFHYLAGGGVVLYVNILTLVSSPWPL
jgi:hypothetical protein